MAAAGRGPLIGVMDSYRDSGAVDAGLILVTNSTYTASSRGEIFYRDAPGRSLPVTDAAPKLASMAIEIG